MKISMCSLGLLALLVPSLTGAQIQIVGTEIYLVRFADLDSPTVTEVPLTPLTQRSGYDNQPSFAPDGHSLLFASVHDDSQADIYRLDLGKMNQERLTETMESEFSPTVLPDGSGFSVVRVEADSTQRLWKFPFGKGDPSLILENIRGVGYHAWVGSDRLALFMVGEPHVLAMADLTTGDTTHVAWGIGRSLRRIPGRKAVSFLQYEAKYVRWIKEFDLDTKKVEIIAPALEGSEDFAWAPGGRLLMAQGPVLSEWNAEREQWETLAVFAGKVPGRITRLDVSADGKWLALVADEKAVP